MRFFSVYSAITRGKNDVRCTAGIERGSLILAYRGSIVLENFFSGQTCHNFVIISNFAPTCSVQQHDTAMKYLHEVSMKIQQFLSGLLSSDQSAGWPFIFGVTCLRQIIMYYNLPELNSFCKLSAIPRDRPNFRNIATSDSDLKANTRFLLWKAGSQTKFHVRSLRLVLGSFEIRIL